MFSVLGIPNSDPKLKPAIRVKISRVTQGPNPFMNGNADFTGCAENEININLGNYTGNLPQAKETIQAFCNQYEVRYEGLGMGYATLSVNGQSKDLTPYHIDINMMLDLIKQHTPSAGQEHHPEQKPQMNAFELHRKTASVEQKRTTILTALEDVTKSKSLRRSASTL